MRLPATDFFVRVGVLGQVGRFRASDGQRYGRGTRVVCRTQRGLETGEILSDASADTDSIGEASIRPSGVQSDEDFDAEASAFFDDITVGAVPDLDSSPSREADAESDGFFDEAAGDASGDGLDQDALDAKLEQAQAIMDAAEDRLDTTTGRDVAVG